MLIIHHTLHNNRKKVLIVQHTLENRPKNEILSYTRNNPIIGLFFLYNGLEWRLHRLCAMFAQPVTKVTLHAIDPR
mgnify:CR=1 FL=1